MLSIGPSRSPMQMALEFSVCYWVWWKSITSNPIALCLAGLIHEHIFQMVLTSQCDSIVMLLPQTYFFAFSLLYDPNFFSGCTPRIRSLCAEAMTTSDWRPSSSECWTSSPMPSLCSTPTSLMRPSSRRRLSVSLPGSWAPVGRYLPLATQQCPVECYSHCPLVRSHTLHFLVLVILVLAERLLGRMELF